MRNIPKSWISAILLFITLIINGLGAFGVINGLSQKEVSDMYLTLITPSPSTFSIWSVIYTLLIASLVIMIIKKDDPYYKSAASKISFLFWLSCAFNIIWIVLFSYKQIGLSTLFIFAFVVTLTLIVKEIGKLQTKKRWLLPLTFGMYAGWLFIATVVNTAAWLVKIEWSGFGMSAEIWSVVVLIISAGLALLVLLNTKNAIFPLPIAWAYFGIYRFLVAPEGFGGMYVFLQTVALLGIVFLIGIAAIQLYRNHYRLMPDTSVLPK